MNKFKHFLGIDVSKEYFDAVIILDGEKSAAIHNQFVNSDKGVKALCKWLKGLNATIDNTLICLEHTGMYGKIIIKYLLAFSYSLWVEMPMRIIRSIGVQRGKSDKVDAERIACYAMKNNQEAVLYKAPGICIDKIRALLSVREKLIKSKVALLKTSTELKSFDPLLAKISVGCQKNTINGIKKDLIKIDQHLSQLIEEDENLSRIYKQAISVPGIGRLTALFLICYTNEFKLYYNARELACYAGVVPFEYASGKSIRAKPKVHYMANKKLKKQLHMCALSAIRNDAETSLYFNRKVAEGKSKMLVVNNIRNKLIHRVCACIRDNRTFEIKDAA